METGSMGEHNGAGSTSVIADLDLRLGPSFNPSILPKQRREATIVQSHATTLRQQGLQRKRNILRQDREDATRADTTIVGETHQGGADTSKSENIDPRDAQRHVDEAPVGAETP